MNLDTTYLWDGNILAFLNIWVYEAVLQTYALNVMLHIHIQCWKSTW
jgi:hypothetical protein